jgi:glycosyltransferase involved in cell wall biosynthesis
VRLGLPADRLLIGVFAHLTPKKGHRGFLEAFASVASKRSGCLAVFVGEGEEREALSAHAETLGLAQHVVFCGFQPDVLPYYAAMDLVVLPSISGEGLPRTLLEAGLLGRASIGSDLSGVPEIIRDEETGFVVPAGDPAALAERMQQLVADATLRERFERAAHEYVATTFTISAMLSGTLNTYERAGARC